MKHRCVCVGECGTHKDKCDDLTDRTNKFVQFWLVKFGELFCVACAEELAKRTLELLK